MFRVWVTPALLGALLAGPAAAQDCLSCHGDRDRLRQEGADPERLAALWVHEERFAASLHGARGCAECHFGYEEFPHPEDAEGATCADCHDDAARAVGASTHGVPEGASSPNAACADCHGVHDVLRPSDPASRLHPLNVSETCGRCHQSPDAPGVETYAGDVHGRALNEGGLVVAATCVSCHGSHGILPPSDERSSVAPRRVPETCAQCHLTPFQEYRKSVHHAALAGGNDEAPSCKDCHRPHRIARMENAALESAVLTCAGCHEERMGTFRSTFHGKLHTLGFGQEVAKCADCHGPHGILPADHPESRVHPDNLVATCAACHEDAHEGFASFLVHADPHDPEENPGLFRLKRAMSWLLAGTFAVAGLHALLWLVRSLLAGEWRRRPRSGRYVRRWRPFYSTLHVTMMFAFLTVAVTGLPLYYADGGWGKALMALLGGPDVTRFLHRCGAVVMVGVILTYLADFVRRLVRREAGFLRGATTMLPRWKDAQDAAANVRWFLGLGPKPTFGRWTYWEKFDFWAVFWGITIIGGSGVVLWFPEAATRVLPGWAINAAQILHGHEALLAVGFIFTIHIFHTQLRPDKFPLDISFFTGRIPEEVFEEERGEEYRQALRDGTLDLLFEPPPAQATRRWGTAVAIIALAIGLFLVTMMVRTLLP